MSSIELTASQKTILRALVDRYRQEETAIKGETIAEEVDRNPGTIRNQMQSLKALQLVEGVPGPKGGYRPTTNAFEALEIEQIDSPAAVPVRRNGDPVEDVNVQNIDLTTVFNPDLCRAEIEVRGSIKDFHEGDSVAVGPTPISKLRVDGTVDAKDEAKNVVILKIEDMIAPAEDPAH
ncbi:TrmB family transcriptional regulator [Halodesulfurarchaeum formicicum]|uniref:TrmB family transcriptional regulator n=1 Tax=Halodesulfurarchaeum formicicum TaxID=1873524 RepID=A0A1D8S3Q4_9EURY|nr:MULTISPECIES: Rrf2 family transcriptional regulator [Halodesulfurarchaeum]AOW79999.1 TrmB family transcriptional regulator [Halodesulfurarchaeum formicicum]APE95293.1 TrmB family transcriptional regulator [Halodesulfurarchaeum formicicum]MDR5657429.1 Rrf2 family transcriptional regulator [Halodesulfurarchaeum sp. HSR-GB]